MNENEKIVCNIFLKRFGIILNEIPKNPPQKTPDFAFEISGFKILAEQKTIEGNSTHLSQMNRVEIDEGLQKIHFFEKSEFKNPDPTWFKMANLLKNASDHFKNLDNSYNSVIILNKDYQDISDLDDVLNGFITTGKFTEPLPSDAYSALQKLSAQIHLIFWINEKENELYVRFIGEIPEAIRTFFQEKLNA